MDEAIGMSFVQNSYLYVWRFLWEGTGGMQPWRRWKMKDLIEWDQ
jgi:hypothetical protein